MSRNQSVEKGPVPKEQVHKPRDFMDEDDVEMVSTHIHVVWVILNGQFR